MRLFVAIDIPLEIKKFLSQISAELSEIHGIKGVSEQNLHLTLVFLGNITDVKTLIKEISEVKMKPFKIKTSRFGFFPNKKRIRVIWHGIDKNLHLQGLYTQIANKTGRQEKHALHLTIARAKFTNHQTKKQIFSILEKHKNKTFEFKVDKFRIYSSELTPMGPVHRVIETFQLEKHV